MAKRIRFKSKTVFSFIHSNISKSVEKLSNHTNL